MIVAQQYNEYKIKGNVKINKVKNVIIFLRKWEKLIFTNKNNIVISKEKITSAILMNDIPPK